jgi:ABC-type transport system involved in multi-copper enzyme maturation permease subunit
LAFLSGGLRYAATTGYYLTALQAENPGKSFPFSKFMRNPTHTAFAAIFQTEVLLNSKRIAPYAMALLFAGNALLWWGWGPATGRGWATNADFFIAGVLPVYSFMTLPLFTAIIMADPVIRDFRTGVDPLIFSKPVRRAEYLLGKFSGNFFVLVCCQASFVLTLFVLQAFRKPGMVVLEVRALPYVKHFLVFVVLSHLVLAAIYFTVGTLTRNAKIVYGFGVSFYPLYITYQTVILKSLPPRWQSVLDPLLMNRGKLNHALTGETLNQLVVVYDLDLMVNRASMFLIAAICLTIVYYRFTTAEKPGNAEAFSMLNLSTATERIYYDPESLLSMREDRIARTDSPGREMLRVLPDVARADEGIRANINKLIAALGVEFQLLLTERSLVVLMPLAIFFSILEVTFYNVIPDVSYSAAYATNTAKSLMLFLIGMTVFYTGEAMHRDREVRIEPVLWATPVPNNVLLLSKYFATLLLTLSLVALVGLTSILIQLLRGHAPVNIWPYLITYSVILVPSLVFMAAASIALNVLLRDKYVAYAVSIATGSGLFYLYSQGYNHWLYNPVLYGLWTEGDLSGGPGFSRVFGLRLYCLAISVASLVMAHFCFARKSN